MYLTRLSRESRARLTLAPSQTEHREESFSDASNIREACAKRRVAAAVGGPRSCDSPHTLLHPQRIKRAVYMTCTAWCRVTHVPDGPAITG